MKIKTNWTKCPSLRVLILFNKSTIFNLRENFASETILLLSEVWFLVKRKLPIVLEACVKFPMSHVKWHLRVTKAVFVIDQKRRSFNLKHVPSCSFCQTHDANNNKRANPTKEISTIANEIIDFKPSSLAWWLKKQTNRLIQIERKLFGRFWGCCPVIHTHSLAPYLSLV